MCCVLCFVCCCLCVCVVCCVLGAVRCVLCIVCCVLCVVSCVLCPVVCVCVLCVLTSSGRMDGVTAKLELYMHMQLGHMVRVAQRTGDLQARNIGTAAA